MILWVLKQISIVTEQQFSEVACFLETSVSTCKATQFQDPEDRKQKNSCSEKPKICNVSLDWLRTIEILQQSLPPGMHISRCKIETYLPVKQKQNLNSYSYTNRQTDKHINKQIQTLRYFKFPITDRLELTLT
jgi:hypothetical protein